jgi:hypothetical protein
VLKQFADHVADVPYFSHSGCSVFFPYLQSIYSTAFQTPGYVTASLPIPFLQRFSAGAMVIFMPLERLVAKLEVPQPDEAHEVVYHTEGLWP